jgi:hypothetical protein
MLHAAQMYGAQCGFHDTAGLARSPELAGALEQPFPALSGQAIHARHARIVACRDLPGASHVFGFHAGQDFALLMGGERRGLSRELREAATDVVQIPMPAHRLGCLNVAAASAVALHYLCGPPVGSMPAGTGAAPGRPELLLLSAGDHFELGSALRSAIAFGWDRAFVEDRHDVWFGRERGAGAGGPSPGRPGPDALRLVPCATSSGYGFPEVLVVTTARRGVPIHRADLARGARLLVVLPDESSLRLDAEDWTRFGPRVQFAHLELPRSEFPYHYRLAATVALAEICRQVGLELMSAREVRPEPSFHDRALQRLAAAAGQMVRLSELMDY